MREEIITSGRMNPKIDPHLNIWHWEIPLYLFLGGLAAGILFFAALYTIQKKEKEFPAAIEKTPLIVPFLLVIGLIALFMDLNHKPFFWRLYTTIRLESPMSWGAWVLMVVTPLSFIWAAIHLKKAFPKFKWPFAWLQQLEEFFLKNKITLAWMMIVSSLILGMYTGILFSAFNARPLWNTSILGPLFLISGLSTGAAMNIIFARTEKEKKNFSRIDLMIIGVEIFLIIHIFMGFLASTQVQIDAAKLFLGGPYTASFWILVVFMGMVLPGILEIMELKKFKIPMIIPAILVLFGGILLRFILTFAGQESRWLY
ncbi:MAG: polysulfide reductase NrfD [Bacteroidales bacterium]|nr:polysulfide reductase NrfD [Bacteroidales bacterium]